MRIRVITLRKHLRSLQLEGAIPLTLLPPVPGACCILLWLLGGSVSHQQYWHLPLQLQPGAELLLCPTACPSAASLPLPPVSNFSCLEVARGSWIADRLEHHSTIQSTLFQRENPPQIVISVHSLFPSSLVLQNRKASRVSWPQLGARRPGIWLAPGSLWPMWQAKFSL